MIPLRLMTQPWRPRLLPIGWVPTVSLFAALLGCQPAAEVAAPTVVVRPSEPPAIVEQGGSPGRKRPGDSGDVLDIRSEAFRILAEEIPESRRTDILMSVVRASIPSELTGEGFRSYFDSEGGRALEQDLEEAGVAQGLLRDLMDSVFRAEPSLDLSDEETSYRDSIAAELDRVGFGAMAPVTAPDLPRVAAQRRPDTCAEYRHCEADHQTTCETIAWAENLYLKYVRDTACAAAAICVAKPLPPCRALAAACLAAEVAYASAHRTSYDTCIEAHCIDSCEVK